MAKRALVVDDEKLIVKGIRFSLEQDDYQVDCAYDGYEALDYARSNSYDVILLDLMLPGMDGLQVCQSIREFSNVPIIMLTAKSDDLDKIMGLEYGADDYITKPFNILEVKARIKAIMRRTVKNASTAVEEPGSLIEKRGLRIDRDNKRVFVNDVEVNLTLREFAILYFLVINEDHVYSRDQLLKLIWGENYDGDSRTVDVHVRRLREKIEPNPKEPVYVQTKWGMGYFFKG